MKMRFDDLDEVFHAQLHMNLLAVDEERRHGFNMRVVAARDILEDSSLQIGRAQALHEFVRIEAEAAGQSDEDRFGIRTVGPFALMLEKSVVHFPVMA